MKFALSAAAILLVGAMAVGLAARAVVSPRMGEVRSAGVVAIPTVLGQTAEEVLFYPWSMYDTQPLRHPTEDELLFGDRMDAWYTGLAGIFFPNWQILLLDGFRLLPFADIPPDEMIPALEWTAGGQESDLFADISPDEILSALEWNVSEQGSSPSYGAHIFLKDFPAAARLGKEGTETPVSLNFAMGTGRETSVSFLIKPALTRELTGEEQAAALERVERDLRLMLLSENLFYSYPDPEMDRLLSEDLPCFHSGLYWLLQIFHDYCIWTSVMPRDPIGLFMDGRRMLSEWLDRALEDPDEAPMEEFLSAVEQSGSWNIQIITTQRQIVALFTGNSGVMFGVYYDIQLGCYSGIGLTG